MASWSPSGTDRSHVDTASTRTHTRSRRGSPFRTRRVGISAGPFSRKNHTRDRVEERRERDYRVYNRCKNVFLCAALLKLCEQCKVTHDGLFNFANFTNDLSNGFGISPTKQGPQTHIGSRNDSSNLKSSIKHSPVSFYSDQIDR